MDELIIALHSLENAVRSLDSFWIAIANLALPLTLSVIVIIQNANQNKRNVQLQNDQFKKDALLRRYDSIFEIYQAFGRFGRYKIEKDIFRALKECDESLAITHVNELTDRYNSIIPCIDLARLLFGGTDDNLVAKLDKIKKDQLDLLDSYIDYTFNKLNNIRSNAWNQLHQHYNGIPIGDIKLLRENIEAYNTFLQLTNNGTLIRLEKAFQENWDCLSYDNYDVYFINYLRISEICNQKKC